MDAKEYNKKWCSLIKDSNVFLETIEQNIQKSDTPEEVMKNFALVGWSPELKQFLKDAVSAYQKILVQQTVETNNAEDKKKPQVYEMAHLMCSMANKPENCTNCPGVKGGCLSITKAEALFDAGFRKQEKKDVGHGEWLLEKEPDGTPYCFHCSVCDPDFSHIGIKSATDYCPNCGAEMNSVKYA